MKRNLNFLVWMIIGIGITLITACGSEPKVKETDWKKFNLKGKVKLMALRSFKVIEVNGKIKKLGLHFALMNSDKNFNKSGFITENLMYGNEKISKFEIDKRKIQSGFRNRYDANNNLIEESMINSKGVVYLTISNEYDDNDRKIRSFPKVRPKRMRDSERIFKYDERGNQIERITRTKGGEILSKTIFHYDQSNRLILSYTLDNKRVDSCERYRYHHNRKTSVERISYYGKAGEFYENEAYIYDQRGNQIEIRRYDIREQDKLLNENDESGIGEPDLRKHVTDKLDFYNSKERLVLLETIRRRFNDRGLVVDSKSFSNKNELINQIAYTYTESGDIHTQISKYNQPSDPVMKFTYIYDKRNNWIRRVESLNGIVNQMAERTILYYTP